MTRDGIEITIHGSEAAIVPTYVIDVCLAHHTLVVSGQPDCPDEMHYVITQRGVANPAAAQFRDWIVSEARISSRKRTLRQV